MFRGILVVAAILTWIGPSASFCIAQRRPLEGDAYKREAVLTIPKSGWDGWTLHSALSVPEQVRSDLSNLEVRAKAEAARVHPEAGAYVHTSPNGRSLIVVVTPPRNAPGPDYVGLVWPDWRNADTHFRINEKVRFESNSVIAYERFVPRFDNLNKRTLAVTYVLLHDPEASWSYRSDQNDPVQSARVSDEGVVAAFRKRGGRLDLFKLTPEGVEQQGQIETGESNISPFRWVHGGRFLVYGTGFDRDAMTHIVERSGDGWVLTENEIRGDTINIVSEIMFVVRRGNQLEFRSLEDARRPVVLARQPVRREWFQMRSSSPSGACFQVVHAAGLRRGEIPDRADREIRIVSSPLRPGRNWEFIPEEGDTISRWLAWDAEEAEEGGPGES